MVTGLKVLEHVIPGQHIREYPRSTRVNQEDLLRIAIKQYIPLITPDPVPKNALTIIALPGNGFPKETYEPFIEDLCLVLQSRGIYVRGIWMADSSNQGASGVLNEDVQGDSTNWFDHSRDLLLMVNHFREEMSRPLIGFAHSYGCAQLVHLSTMHPRLLSTLILCEPVILFSIADGPNPAMLSSVRRDLWDSRETAEKALRKSFKTWDPRMLDKYVEFGLRSVPTAIYNSRNTSGIPTSSVTLTTTKHQEAWTYVFINVEDQDDRSNQLFRPDQDPEKQLPAYTVRPESMVAARFLQYLRPSVLYVFGSESILSSSFEQNERLRSTGIGQGGSGGVAAGKVERAVYEGGGHLIPFDQTARLVQTSSDWIEKWFSQWLKDEEEIQKYKNWASDDEGLRTSKEWLKAVKIPLGRLRPLKQKL